MGFWNQQLDHEEDDCDDDGGGAQDRKRADMEEEEEEEMSSSEKTGRVQICDISGTGTAFALSFAPALVDVETLNRATNPVLVATARRDSRVG